MVRIFEVKTREKLRMVETMKHLFNAWKRIAISYHGTIDLPHVYTETHASISFASNY